MSLAASLGSALDGALSVVAPRMAAHRLAARDAMAARAEFKARSAKYSAAKVDRVNPWLPVGGDANSIIASSSPIVRDRARQLIRDFPYFTRAVKVLTALTTGTEINFQSRVRDADGKLDRKINQKIEDAVKWWNDEADISGRLDFHRINRLARRQAIENGEAIIRYRWDRDPARVSPFCLEMVEADYLTDFVSSPRDGAKISQGIEYDPDRGAKPLAYWLANPDKPGSPDRVPADQVVHIYEVLRPGQLRGISYFHAAIIIAHALGDHIATEQDAARMAARWLAFVESGDPMSRTWNAQTDPNTGEKIEELYSGIIEYLRPGEKVNLASANRPGDNFEAFTKLILRMIAAAIDLSYEILTMDYSQVNYATLRVARGDQSLLTTPMWSDHSFRCTKPIIKTALDSMVMAGELDLPNYWKLRRVYHRFAILPPGVESVDQLRDIKADEVRLRLGLVSQQELAAQRGRDLGEVLTEQAEAAAMAEELGLNIGPSGSTNMKNNPAALGVAEEASNA